MEIQIISIAANFFLGVVVMFLTRSVSKHDKREGEREKCRSIELWYATKTGNLAYKTARLIQEEKNNFILGTAIKEYTEAETSREKLMNETFMKGGI